MSDIGTDPKMGTAEALALLARKRDAGAWARILEVHGAEIFRTSRSILMDGELAEDACQESLLRVRDRAGLFSPDEDDPEGSARNWIRRVACHTALNMRRGRQRALQREQAAADTRAHQADRSGSKAQMLEIVRRELARLPDDERVPIQLHFYGELTYAEVAGAMDCQVGAAKMRVHRGLEKMRRRLGMMGLFLGLGQLSAWLVASGVRASELTGTDPALEERWQALLESPTSASGRAAERMRGLSIMAKISIGVAVGFVASFLVLTMQQSMGAVRDGGAGPVGGEERTEARLPSDGGNVVAPRGEERALVAKATKIEQRAVVLGNNAFAVDLYRKLQTQKGNLFFSPFSISTALAMTYAGAKGKTAGEMATALHFTLKQDRLHPAFAALLKVQNEVPAGKKRGYQLSVANALWGQRGYAFHKPFLDLTRSHYGAGLTELDFVNDTEGSRKTINAWVEKKTQDKIKELLKKGVITRMVRLVLTNAIYFKGSWFSEFNKNVTFDAPFQVSAAEKVKVPMMSQSAQFKYGAFQEAGGIQVLELPYEDKELSMFVLLPEQLTGLAKLENQMNRENLSKWLAATRSQEVEVYLPKFRISAQFQLKKVLMALGMKDAFSRAADFSGMTGREGLFISAVIHKAFVDVNEEGTEAAAATAVVMKSESEPPPPPVFRADRPFIFLIRDNRSKSILFIGRLADPR